MMRVRWIWIILVKWMREGEIVFEDNDANPNPTNIVDLLRIMMQIQIQPILLI
jgi:hypothetical protein